MKNKRDRFLQQVLPQTQDGIYYVVRGANGSADNVQATTRQGLIDYAKGTGGTDGFNSWYAPASFMPGTIGRKQENLASSTCFVLDIDIRPDRPLEVYTSLEEVRLALKVLCDKGVVPPPSYCVGTGGGIHAYWVTNRSMDATEHRSRAAVFVAAIQAHDPKLGKDAKLTRNANSLYRLIGSYNYKYHPAPLVDLMDLADVCDNAGTAYGPDAIAPLGASMPLGSTASSTSVRNIGAPAPILQSSADLYDGCAVMRYVRDNRAQPDGSPDRISYDLWRHAIALLSYTEDVDQAAQAMSQGGPTYDPNKVAQQVEIEKNQYGSYPPITCATLCSFLNGPNPRRMCVGCPSYSPNKGTPYRAGADAESRRVAREQANAATKPAGLEQADSMVKAAYAPDTSHILPAGIPPKVRLRRTPAATLENSIIIANGDADAIVAAKSLSSATKETDRTRPLSQLGITLDPTLVDPAAPVYLCYNSGGLFAKMKNDDGEYEAQRIGTGIIWPLRFATVIAITGEKKRVVQCLVVKIEDGDVQARHVNLEPSALMVRPDSMAKAIGDVGVFVGVSLKERMVVQRWLYERLSRLSERSLVTTEDQFGWNGEGADTSFLYGDFRFTKGEPLSLIVKSAKLERVADVSFRLQGSLEGARSVLTFVGNYGSDVLRFATAVAAGAPLMPHSGAVGAFVNLFGSSGKGKSLTGSIISGMWGNGTQNGALITSKDTVNARYAKLSAMNNLPVVHEEATVLVDSLSNPHDPLGAGEYLYSISDGAGRGRVTRTGILQDQHQWSTIVFGTSNSSVWQRAILGSEKQVAQAARAFELEIATPVIDTGDPTLDNKLMRKLGEAASASSGVAGMVLAEYLANNREALRDAMVMAGQAVGQLDPTTSAEQRTRRAVLSAAMVGGMMLTQTGLWGVDPNEVAALVQKIATTVKVFNASHRLNVADTIAIIAQAVQANTAVMRPAQINSARTISPQHALGAVVTPRYDLKARVDLYAQDTAALLTIRRDVMEHELRLRGIDFAHFWGEVLQAGYDVAAHPVSIHDGILAPSRDMNGISPLAAPPVQSVVFHYTTTGATPNGAAPALRALVKKQTQP